MKRLISFIAFALLITFANNLSAQIPTKDVVYLKNGSIVKGVITEIVPDVNLKIKTTDGNLFVFEMKDVEKIIKEEISQIPTPTQRTVNNEGPITTTATLYREPAISTLCSFLIPGLGQFYNGQSYKGTSYLLWYLGSYGIIVFSYFQMFEIDVYGNISYTTNAVIWSALGFAASISGVASWVVSLVDANRSSKAINRQLGLASFQLGEGANISFNPDIRLVNDYSLINSNKISPSYGLNMRISF